MDVQSKVEMNDVLDLLIEETTITQIRDDEFTVKDYHDRAMETGYCMVVDTARKKLYDLVEDGRLTKRVALQNGKSCVAFRVVDSESPATP